MLAADTKIIMTGERMQSRPVQRKGKKRKEVKEELPSSRQKKWIKPVELLIKANTRDFLSLFLLIVMLKGQ